MINAEKIIIIGEITAEIFTMATFWPSFWFFGRHFEFEAKIQDAVSIIIKRRLLLTRIQ